MDFEDLKKLKTPQVKRSFGVFNLFNWGGHKSDDIQAKYGVKRVGFFTRYIIGSIDFAIACSIRLAVFMIFFNFYIAPLFAKTAAAYLTHFGVAASAQQVIDQLVKNGELYNLLGVVFFCFISGTLYYILTPLTPLQTTLGARLFNVRYVSTKTFKPASPASLCSRQIYGIIPILLPLVISITVFRSINYKILLINYSIFAFIWYDSIRLFNKSSIPSNFSDILSRTAPVKLN
jgi:hypothetical protein